MTGLIFQRLCTAIAGLRALDADIEAERKEQFADGVDAELLAMGAEVDRGLAALKTFLPASVLVVAGSNLAVDH